MEVSRLCRLRSIFVAGIISLLALSALFPSAVFAQSGGGFGITPPYVTSDRLTRGSVYQQKITIVRGDPVEDLQAEISINVPGIDHWFSVDRGEKFLLKKGERHVPIIISVHVPPDAEYKEYSGAIRIRTAPLVAPKSGGVSIALGAQIDVDLAVVDKIFDFEIRKVHLADLEEGYRRWGLYFPGRIRLFMTVENTGNTVFGPTKVTLDIYDKDNEVLLESVENKNKLRTLAPFSIEEVVAEFPTKLPVGTYSARYTIYKMEDVANQGTLTLAVQPFGSIPGYEGYGWNGLSLADKAKVIGFGALLLVLITGLVLFIASIIAKWRAIRRHRR